MLISLLGLSINYIVVVSSETPPEYVKQCSRSDPQIKACLISALHHLRPYIKVGIPEIELPAIEPFRMDELTLSLTGGVNGYKVELTELFVKGASNFSVQDIKIGTSFEAIVTIPELELNSKYFSSGILIILPASSNGTFNAKFHHIESVVRGSVSTIINNNKTYLNVDSLDIQLRVRDVFMQIRRNPNYNQIIGEVTNLFLRENGQEVLKVMEPQLKKKLSALIIRIVNQLLQHVPVETFLSP